MLKRASLGLLLCVLSALPATGVLPPPSSENGGPLRDWDIRGLDSLDAEATPTPAQLYALAELAREVSRQDPEQAGLVVRWGPQPGTLHQLFRRSGYLTARPATPSLDHEAVARGFLARHRALLGLSRQGLEDLALVRRMADPGTQAVHLLFEQRVDGVEVFLGLVQVHLDRHGRILAIGGNTARDTVLSAEVRLSAAAALAAAGRSVRVPLEDAPEALRTHAGRTHFARGPFAAEPEVDPTWFPTGSGLVRAWRVLVDPVADPGWYQVVVDAASGQVLSRYDLVDNIATEGLVFREDPGQGPQLLLPFVDDSLLTDPASPAGWTPAGETEGNNCDVKDDKADDDEATAGQRAAASGPAPLSFSFPFTDNPADDLEAVLTNLFYLNNWLHDRLVLLGFDEAAGNFQEVNFGPAGRGGDRVLVDAQDGGGRNNANFGTPPDGTHPRMQMYIWNRTNPNRDSGFDSSVVTHELFHGVSNRLVGGGDNVGCLATAQGGAMGEGWSDFFPCSFWDQPTVGGYLVNNYVRGIRRSAYDTHPFDYGQLCNQGGFEVHRDGEIWAATLWDIRQLFIQRYGYHEGKCKVERLVLDGMKLSPCMPAYIDMRDAILLAGRLHGFDGDVCLLWEGFAGRGMGVDAVRATGCTNGQAVTSYDAPTECTGCSVSPPTGMSLDTSLPNQVVARFTPSPEADEHLLLRSRGPCPDQCLQSEFVEVARGGPTASELRDVDADQNRLSVGETWSYRILALQGDACTAFGECDAATITGRCTLVPQPLTPGAIGVTALTRPPGPECSIQVEWAETAPVCTGPAELRTNIYRSEDPGFTPGPENLIASVPASELSYDDAAVPAAAVTYVVRAEDLTVGGSGPHGGNEESNDRRFTLAPQGPVAGSAPFTDDAEAGELAGYRRTGAFEPNDWQVVADSNTRGGSAWHVTGAGGGTADKNLELPPLSLGSAPRLTFAHTFDFENRFDGAVIEISTDRGRTWTDLLDDFVSGEYATSNGSGTSLTVGGLINPPNTNQLWTGENASGFGTWDAVEVDLAPYAGTLDAVLRFRCLLDPMAFEPGGWYVDDIVVDDTLTFEACQSTCTSPPQAVLGDTSLCAPAAEPATLLTDGSASVPGSAGFAAELSHVLTHDGPGSFDGRSWAAGPMATLTFPPGTTAGDYSVTLTVRGADTCSDETTARVTLETEVLPPASVGNTLKAVRHPSGLALTWGDVGATDYNVHLVDTATGPVDIYHTAPERSVVGGSVVLDTGLALPGTPSAFIGVYSATSCGRSIP